MKWFLVTTALAGLAVGGAFGRNVINEHSGYYQEGTHYTIVQDGPGNDIAVLIHKDSVWTQIWKFEAYDSATEAPGYIDYIRIQPTDDVGSIQLRIVGAPPHQYGAHDVKEIDLLAHADNTTEVSVYISGDFGQTGPMLAHYVGSVAVYGDLLGSILPQYDISGHTVIAGTLLANIEADSVTGNITISGSGNHPGDITIGSSYGGGSITVNGTMAGDITTNGMMTAGNITTNGTLGGKITIWGTMAGNITTNGPMPGNITMNETMTGSLSAEDNLSGLVTINGNMDGQIDVQNTLTGSIDVNGDVVYGDNWVQIRRMAGGHFECNNLDLRLGAEGKWFVLGHGVFNPNLVQSGTITVNDTLSGRIYIRGRSELAFDVNTIDAHEDSGWRRGGIEVTTEFKQNSNITVSTFTEGRIGYPDDIASEHNPASMKGTITINGSMGTYSEISTRQDVGNQPILPLDVDAAITVKGDMDGLIASTRHINGAINLNETALMNTAGDIETVGSETQGQTGSITGPITIHGDLSATGEIFAFDNLTDTVTIEADMAGKIKIGSISTARS